MPGGELGASVFAALCLPSSSAATISFEVAVPEVPLNASLPSVNAKARPERLVKKLVVEPAVIPKRAFLKNAEPSCFAP